MAAISIRAEQLSKRYRIGKRQASYKTFREALTDAVASRVRRVGRRLRGEETSGAADDAAVWAVRDASFEIEHGAVVGIIGRNGAGKSTLLKMLSRITEPTGGHAEVSGRLSSLLEVGTGFHPELTGRENVYLNGAVLGMKRKEIRSKFEEIVAFSGVEKFLDTPVKRFSSGMLCNWSLAGSDPARTGVDVRADTSHVLFMSAQENPCWSPKLKRRS